MILLIFVLNSVAELIEVLHGQSTICPTPGKALHLLFALFDFNNGVSFGIICLCNANSSGHCGLVLCFSVEKHAFDADCGIGA